MSTQIIKQLDKLKKSINNQEFGNILNDIKSYISDYENNDISITKKNILVTFFQSTDFYKNPELKYLIDNMELEHKPNSDDNTYMVTHNTNITFGKWLEMIFTHGTFNSVHICDDEIENGHEILKFDYDGCVGNNRNLIQSSKLKNTSDKEYLKFLGCVVYFVFFECDCNDYNRHYSK